MIKLTCGKRNIEYIITKIDDEIIDNLSCFGCVIGKSVIIKTKSLFNMVLKLEIHSEIGINHIMIRKNMANKIYISKI